MNELLARIVDAHGGIDSWNRYERVEATIVWAKGLTALDAVPSAKTSRGFHSFSKADRIRPATADILPLLCAGGRGSGEGDRHMAVRGLPRAPFSLKQG